MAGPEFLLCFLEYSKWVISSFGPKISFKNSSKAPALCGNFILLILWLMEELTKAIGHPPTIKQEVWCKSNMVKHLETLKEKAKVVA